MVGVAFSSKNVQHPPYFAWSRSLRIFHFYPHSGTSFFEVNIVHNIIGILQLATPKGTVGVSTVIHRKSSAFSNNLPPSDCFATNLLTINYNELSNGTSCEIRLDFQLQPQCKWFCGVQICFPNGIA